MLRRDHCGWAAFSSSMDCWFVSFEAGIDRWLFCWTYVGGRRWNNSFVPSWLPERWGSTSLVLVQLFSSWGVVKVNDR